MTLTDGHDWATGTIKEVPFWRDGMTPEEYDLEREYFYTHRDEYTRGQYTPLWKQRQGNEATALPVINTGDTTNRNALLKACLDKGMPVSSIEKLTAPMCGKSNEEKERIAKEALEKL